MPDMKINVLICLACLSLVSCRQSKPRVKTNTELLSQKTWILREARNKNASGNWETVFLLIDSCRRDNLVNFSASGNYIVDEGPTKCYPVDSQIFLSGTWAFDKNETELVLFGTQRNTILVLNEDTLKYLHTIPVGWGSTEGELTYSH